MIRKFKSSKKLLEFVTVFEGDIHYAYNDPAGHCTAARGKLLHLGNCNQSDYNKYGTKDHPKLTTEDTAKMLAQDIKPYELAVNNLAAKGLAQLQRNERQQWFDSMVTLAYNIGYGQGGFGGSTLLRLFNAGDFAGASKQFMAWVYAGGRILEGLKRRRKEEKQIALKGDYSVA